MAEAAALARLLPDDWPIVAEGARFEAVQATLAERCLGDGLPAVPPTAARLHAMLGAAAPGQSHGFMPPLFGELTTAAAAYCAVLAGCVAEELPIVVAAAAATLEPEFNLLGLMTTTGSAAVVTIVHGPIASRLGMNSAVNCFGPGNRANACIGRAISLVLRNIGGARERTGDMATVGQPAKYGFCFAEGEEGPALGFPLLAERRGLAAGTSGVTVLGISGTAEILPTPGRETPPAILDPVAEAMRAAFLVNGAAKQPVAPEQVFVLPPELARQMHEHGWDLGRVQAYLFEASAAAGRPITPSPGDIVPIVTGGPGVKMAHLPIWGGGSQSMTRAVVSL